MKHSYLTGFRLIALLAAFVAGCSDPHSTSSLPLRVRWSRDPERLDPLALPNQFAIDAANLLHMSLLQVDPVAHAFRPALAETLPQVQLLGDSLTRLHYQLRQAASWPDGQPVTAHDVALTLKLLYCAGLPVESTRAQFAFIRQVEPDASNARRFALLCRGQAPEYAQASGDFFVLPEAQLDPTHQLRRWSLAELQRPQHPAAADSALAQLSRRYLAALPQPGQPGPTWGCGAYELVSWTKDQQLRFRRKAHWWAAAVQPTPLVLQAQPTELSCAIIPDDATAALALRRGELDIYPQVPAAQFAQLQAADASRKQLAFYTAPSYDVVMAGFNTRRPALADSRTRRALSYLFDADRLLHATQRGGHRTVGLIHPTDKLNYNDSLRLRPFAPDSAVALLRAAGWQQAAPGQPWRRAGLAAPLALQFRYRTDDVNFETIALQFRAAAAQQGIPVRLQPVEAAALTPTLQSGDFDLYVRTTKGNPFIFNFMPILHSSATGAGNFTGYGNPASDRLVEDIAAAASPQQKARLLRRLQARLHSDAPLVPLFFLPTRVAANRQLRDLHVNGIKPGYLLTTVRRSAAAPR